MCIRSFDCKVFKFMIWTTSAVKLVTHQIINPTATTITIMIRSIMMVPSTPPSAPIVVESSSKKKT